MAERAPTWDELPEILTPEDIRAYLRFDSLTAVYRLLREGRIRAIGYHNGKKDTRYWRVTKDAFREYVFGNSEGGTG